MQCELGNGRQTSGLGQQEFFQALEATSMHDASPSVLRFSFSERNVHLNLSALDWYFTLLPSSEPVSGIKLDADGVRDLAFLRAASQAGRENGSRNLTLSILLVYTKSCAYSRPSRLLSLIQYQRRLAPLKSGSGRARDDEDGPARRTFQTSSDA